jgi:hypothetical protein
MHDFSGSRRVEPSTTSVNQRTENERKWVELHGISVLEGQSVEAALPASSEADREIKAASAPAPLPEVKLQPRLKSTIADELD